MSKLKWLFCGVFPIFLSACGGGSSSSSSPSPSPSPSSMIKDVSIG